MSDRIAVVGRGSLGRLLVRMLRRAGVEARSTSGRDPSRQSVAWATVVVIAVPDPFIANVARVVARSIGPKSVVLHAAGARSVEELRAAADAGAAVGVVHPLVSFARGAQPSGFERTVFVVDGAPRAIRAASRIARSLGATPIVAGVHGPAYHATAALVANGAVALVNEATSVLEGLGFGRADAEAALAGLLATVVSNLRQVGVPEALTGPIARGDAETVLAHRRALASRSRAALDVYDGVAPATLRCAVSRGLGRREAESVRKALEAEVTPRRRR